MSNLNSYNILINRFKAFADGHFLLKNFTYGAITLADLQKFGLYPFMHIVPVDVSYETGVKNFSFDIFFADLPREEDNKAEYQKETLSDLQQIAEDLLGEITNHRVLFGRDVTVLSSRLVPFEEEFSNVLTGWNLSITLQIPYNWSACEIPATFNDYVVYNQNTGESSILEFKDSIVREGGEVRLVNDVEFPDASYYYGTDQNGERGWFAFPTDEVGLTCETLGACSTIIDIQTNITNLENDVEDISANVVQLQTDLTTLEESLSAVATSGDYNDLINTPTIPTSSDFVEDAINDGVTTKAPSENAVYDALALKFNIPSGTTSDYLDGAGTPTPFPTSLPTSEVSHEVKLGSTMTKGTPVYVSSADGTNMIVSPASNTSEATSSKTMGLLMSSGNTNAKVQVITEGLLAGLNTSTATIGDAVWLGSSGTLVYGLANKPVAPLHMVFIGIVTRVNTNNGEIFVKVQNGFEIDELHNVAITNPLNNDFIQYDSSVQLWKNKNITLTESYYEQFMVNQFSYFLPKDSSTIYDTLRIGGTLNGTGTISSLSENPMGIQYQTAIAVGSVAGQYGNSMGGSMFGANFQFECIRKFRIGTTNNAQRFFAGLSNLYSISIPTNIEPTNQINSIGVCKTQSSSTLYLMWNDATGIASFIDTGFSAISTSFTYMLRIYKKFGISSITIEITQITNSNGNTSIFSTTINSDYNTGVNYFPVIWMGNNTGVSGSVSFKDYGCMLTKRNAISS